MKKSPAVRAIAVFAGLDTTGVGPGLLKPTGGGLGSNLLSKADVDVSQSVQLLQVIDLATGADVSSSFILATLTKDAVSSISTPQIFQVQGFNYAGATFIATFGMLDE